MFWMFLVNALGMITMFGFFFYLLLITQKGGLFATKPGETLAFFVRFFAHLSHTYKTNNCSLTLPGFSKLVGQKNRRNLRLFALLPGQTPGDTWPSQVRKELLFGLVLISKLLASASVSVFGVGLRSRCCISFAHLAPGHFLSEHWPKI